MAEKDKFKDKPFNQIQCTHSNSEFSNIIVKNHPLPAGSWLNPYEEIGFKIKGHYEVKIGPKGFLLYNKYGKLVSRHGWKDFLI